MFIKILLSICSIELFYIVTISSHAVPKAIKSRLFETQLVSNDVRFDVRGKSGSKRVGGYSPKGKGSRYVVGY